MSTTAGLDQALELKRAGRLDEAVIALEAALDRAPRNAVALVHLADVQVRRRRFADAADALERAEAQAGTTAFSARVRGDLLYRRQQWAAAARAYSEADVLGWRDTWPLVQLARCHLRGKDLEAARSAAARAVERDGSRADGWVVLGEVAQREDNLDEAVTLFERACERDPRDQFAYARLMEARLRRLPPEERAREVEVLLRSSGRDNRHLMRLLAGIQRDLGDEGKAAGTWRALRERHGGDLFARKQEGYALRRAGRLDEAAALFKACLLEDPEDMILFRNYINTQRTRGALEELRATLEQLLPIAGTRRGAVYGELRKLPPPDAPDAPDADDADA